MYSPYYTQQQHNQRATARATTTQILAAVQDDLARVRELDGRGDAEPLTALERLELASRYATLADAVQRAADTWQTADSPLAAAYESLIIGYRDASALHEALAEIAPAHEHADPFAER